MWKRLNKPSEKAIGSPTLIETSLDEDSAAKLTDIDEMRGNGIPALQASQMYTNSMANGRGKKLPSVPVIVHDQAPQSPSDRPLPAAPFARQDSSEMYQKRPRLEIPQSSHAVDDISPPDSPRTLDGARSSSPNVSPITDGGSIFRDHTSDSRTYASNIPLPTQQASGGRAAYIAGWRDNVGGGQALGKRDPRRASNEKYPGNRSNGEKAAAPLAVPGSASTRYGNHQTEHTATMSSGNAQAYKPVYPNSTQKAKRETSGPAQAKEEWKGASGRSAIVALMPDKPAPLNKGKALPTPSQRRKQQGVKQTQGPRQALGGQDSPVQLTTGHSSPSQNPARISPPLDARPPQARKLLSQGIQPTKFPPRSDSARPENYDLHRSSPLPAIDTDFQAPGKQSPLSPEALLNIVATPERVETPPRAATFSTQVDLSGSLLPSAIEQLNLYKEPGSRFSATTYATTIPESPPGTPDMSQDDTPPLPTLTHSILNRKRPVPTSGVKLAAKPEAYSPIKPPSRKPAPSEFGTLARDGKSLPLTPFGVKSVDRVTLLEAKLASLHERRRSLETIIHELTHVVQPSSISYDIASRQEIKKTVEGLNKEKAAVAKDIHETGLKLLRATKKRDESYEPTGLWVRRVTE